MRVWLGVVVVVAAGALALWLGARRRRRARIRSLAGEIAPEIRAIVRSADPSGNTDGEPATAARYAARERELSRRFPSESFYAVRTFYQCVEAYRESRLEMQAAFEDGEARSLGDRIRAKDHRDRCLKDVYYTGEAAAQILERLS